MLTSKLKGNEMSCLTLLSERIYVGDSILIFYIQMDNITVLAHFMLDGNNSVNGFKNTMVHRLASALTSFFATSITAPTTPVCTFG